MTNKQHIIFDLDDTLIDTSHVYWEARNAFTNLFDHQNVTEAQIIDIFEEIDEKNMRLYGLSPERYGHSMVHTFNYLSELNKSKINPEIERVVKKLASMVPTTIPKLIDGALDLLEWASERYTLGLLTRGITDFQIKKIKTLKIDKYFKSIQVVEKKGISEFQEFLTSINALPEGCWVVGDSIKSDINPAVNLGLKPILYLYSHHTYLWRQEYGAASEGKFYLAKSLSEVKSILSSPEEYKKIDKLS